MILGFEYIQRTLLAPCSWTPHHMIANWLLPPFSPSIKMCRISRCPLRHSLRLSKWYPII